MPGKRDRAVTEVEEALVANIKEISDTLKKVPEALENKGKQLANLERLAQNFSALTSMNVGASAKFDPEMATKVRDALDKTLNTSYQDVKDLKLQATKAASAVDDFAKQLSEEPAPKRMKPGS